MFPKCQTTIHYLLLLKDDTLSMWISGKLKEFQTISIQLCLSLKKVNSLLLCFIMAKYRVQGGIHTIICKTIFQTNPMPYLLNSIVCCTVLA